MEDKKFIYDINLIKKLKRFKYKLSSQKNCNLCKKQFVSGEIIKKFPCNHIYHETCLIFFYSKNLKIILRCEKCNFEIK